MDQSNQTCNTVLDNVPFNGSACMFLFHQTEVCLNRRGGHYDSVFHSPGHKKTKLLFLSNNIRNMSGEENILLLRFQHLTW